MFAWDDQKTPKEIAPIIALFIAYGVTGSSNIYFS